MKNLEIGFRTKHYQLIYQDGKALNNLLDLPRGAWAHASLNVHLEKYHHSKSCNIWYDEKNNLCFSQAQCKRDGIPGKDHHFLDFKHAFLSGYYGAEYTKWDTPDPFGNVNRLGNDDIIYSVKIIDRVKLKNKRLIFTNNFIDGYILSIKKTK